MPVFSAGLWQEIQVGSTGKVSHFSEEREVKINRCILNPDNISLLF